jgi:hypothetical protein
METLNRMSTPDIKRKNIAPTYLSALCATWLMAVPADALGQGLEPIAPSAWVGAALILGQPTGQFADYVDFGFGGTGHARWSPDPTGIFGLRVDGSFLVYGSETRRYGLLPLIDVDVTTNNQIAGLQIGPQLTFGRSDVRVYGYGQLGFSYFSTTSSVEGSGNIAPFANTTNFDDFTFATSGGGGILFQVSHGRNPVALDLGVRYLYNGRARYLREGSIEITGNTVTYTPIESQTNLVLYQIGVSVGLGRH